MNKKPENERRVRLSARLAPKTFERIKRLRKTHNFRSQGAAIDAAIKLLDEALGGKK